MVKIYDYWDVLLLPSSVEFKFCKVIFYIMWMLIKIASPLIISYKLKKWLSKLEWFYLYFHS